MQQNKKIRRDFEPIFLIFENGKISIVTTLELFLLFSEILQETKCKTIDMINIFLNKLFYKNNINVHQFNNSFKASNL